MTEKKENILQSALKLFANEGYASVSTSKVAKDAGVSEGLIFRHFESKEGLLTQVIGMGFEKIKPQLHHLLTIDDPKKYVQALLDIPENMIHTDAQLWRLISSLKYMNVELYHRLDTSSLFEPLVDKAEKAFAFLGYKNPAMEARTMVVTIEGLIAVLLKDGFEQIRDIVVYLKQKYDE